MEQLEGDVSTGQKKKQEDFSMNLKPFSCTAHLWITCGFSQRLDGSLINKTLEPLSGCQ